jgi:transcriptional regulator with XRE-family HTH domain
MSDVTDRVAFALRDLRKKRGWSLDKTAQMTGVSKAMLGQIERAESSPTIATLWKIASGFHVPFSLFLSEEIPEDRIAQPITLHPNDDKIKVLPLFPYDQKLGCEIFLIELLSGCEHLSLPHESGVIEHVLVVEGSVEVLIGDSWRPLTKGEGMRFRADKPHGYRNLSKKKSLIYDVIHYHINDLRGAL